MNINANPNQYVNGCPKLIVKLTQTSFRLRPAEMAIVYNTVRGLMLEQEWYLTIIRVCRVLAIIEHRHRCPPGHKCSPNVRRVYEYAISLTLFFSGRQWHRTLTHSWKHLTPRYSQASVPPLRSTAFLPANKPSVVCLPLLQSGADLVNNGRTAKQILSAVQSAISSHSATHVTIVGHSLGMSRSGGGLTSFFRSRQPKHIMYRWRCS